ILLGRSCFGSRKEQPRKRSPRRPEIRAAHTGPLKRGAFFVLQASAARWRDPPTPPQRSLKTEQRATRGHRSFVVRARPPPSMHRRGLITPSCRPPHCVRGGESAT